MSDLVRDVEVIGRFEAHRIGEDVVYYDPEPHRYYSEVKENPKSKGGYSFVKASALTGVSTPLKALDTNVDPLLHWAAGLDQVGIAELIGISIDSGEDLGWMRDPLQLKIALREADLTWDKVRDKTATRGTNVHELIFLALATGKRPPSLKALSAEERAYGQAAIRWWRDHDPEPLFAEQVTYHRGHRVAGRFDLLANIEWRGERIRALIDAKTREKGKARRSDHAQLSGYEMCNVACGIGESDRQFALILKPDGTYEVHESVATEADFIAALEAYRRGGDLDKRMRAQARELAAA